MDLSQTVKDIRKNWAIGDAIRDEGLVTPDDIKRFDNLSYGPYGNDNLLDIYVQKKVTNKQPTIVNIHGGAWVYGNKEVYQFYCMSLAQRGFTVVNINYRLAPEHRFPAAVEDINQVMTFLEKQGSQYYVDINKLILIGDSAGAQMVSHYATILTNPEFAGLFDFTLPNIKVAAVALNCGPYNGRAMAVDKENDVFLEYVDGIDQTVPESVLERIDALKYMNGNYPPAYIMSAENDFLLENAQPLYDHLQKLGVPCVVKIYGSKEQKEIGHVFEVNIKLKEATKCNDDECAFFRKYI